MQLCSILKCVSFHAQYIIILSLLFHLEYWRKIKWYMRIIRETEYILSMVNSPRSFAISFFAQFLGYFRAFAGIASFSILKISHCFLVDFSSSVKACFLWATDSWWCNRENSGSIIDDKRILWKIKPESITREKCLTRNQWRVLLSSAERSITITKNFSRRKRNGLVLTSKLVRANLFD